MQKKTKQLQIILLYCALILPGFLGSCSERREKKRGTQTIALKSIGSNGDDEAFIEDEQEPTDQVTSPIDEPTKLTDKELSGSTITKAQIFNEQGENQENDEQELANAQDYLNNNQLANSLPNILSSNNILSLSEGTTATLPFEKKSLLANSPVESTKEERLERLERLVNDVGDFKKQLEMQIQRINVRLNKTTAKPNSKKNKNSKILKEFLAQKKAIENLYRLLPSIKGNLESIENSEDIFAEIQNKYYHTGNNKKPV